jgi:hypothetical protein
VADYWVLFTPSPKTAVLAWHVGGPETTTQLD